MIRIVKDVFVRSLDRNDGIVCPVAFIPGTASYGVKSSVDDNGRIAEITLEMTIPRHSRLMRDSLVITVILDDGTRRVIGTEDLPARFEFKEEAVIRATCKWQTSAYGY